MYECYEKTFVDVPHSQADLAITILTADHLPYTRFDLCSPNSYIITADRSNHLLTLAGIRSHLL